MKTPKDNIRLALKNECQVKKEQLKYKHKRYNKEYERGIDMQMERAVVGVHSDPKVKGIFSGSRGKLIKKNIPLLIMFTPVALFFLIYHYFPMFGVIIAFKDYNLSDGILGSPWNGLYNFKFLFRGKGLQVIFNTLYLSTLNIVFGFPAPIIFAILLNEVRKAKFKKILQTVTFMPHFLSWVVIAGVVSAVFATNLGTVNQIIMKPLFGVKISFLYEAKSWIAIYVGSGIWKEMGFSAIIYIASLATIDPSLYEAVNIDGGGRFKQMWYVTLPSLRPTIVLLLILAIGRLMSVGFDQAYALQNASVIDVSEIISTYIYKSGIQKGEFSVTTAMGLFNSVVNFVLIFTANKIARIMDQSLW